MLSLNNGDAGFIEWEGKAKLIYELTKYTN